MPAIWPVLWAFLVATVIPLVVRAAAALGFGVVTYYGLSFAVDAAESAIMARFDGLPADLWAILRIMGIDTGIGIVFGCVAARIALNAVNGRVSKPTWRAPHSENAKNGNWTA